MPHVTDGESLAHALPEQWPSYFGFALSFFTIGIMWVNHHAMFKDIDRADHTLIILNILLLMCISFVPFTTAVLAEYMKDQDNARAATLAYGGTYVITSVLFISMWLWAATGRRLIDEHVSDARLAQRTRRYLPGAPLYAIGLAIALVNTWAAILWWVALALFYVLPPEE